MYKFLIAFSFAFLPFVSSAASISSTDHFAWGDRMGWVNFSPSNGSVQVTDSGMTGYVWSAILGWINLSPSNGGVMNDGRGDLSGFAWGEQTGWIDFGGVSIDASGVFSGEATSSLAGTINFSCEHCLVTTSWRRAGESSSGGSRSGTSRRNFIGNISSYMSSIFGFGDPEIPLDQGIASEVGDISPVPSVIPDVSTSSESASETSYSVVASSSSSALSTSSKPVITLGTSSASTAGASRSMGVFHVIVVALSSIWKAFAGLFR